MHTINHEALSAFSHWNTELRDWIFRTGHNEYHVEAWAPIINKKTVKSKMVLAITFPTFGFRIIMTNPKFVGPFWTKYGDSDLTIELSPEMLMEILEHCLTLGHRQGVIENQNNIRKSLGLEQRLPESPMDDEE